MTHTLRRLLSATLLPVALSACSATKAAPDFDTAAMDALLSTAVETGDVIGVSAVVFDEGVEVYRGAYGLSDREREVAVTDDTVWRIYSMTKPVVSALIMDLVEDGLVDLQEPAKTYIPQLGQMKVVSLGDDGQPKYEDQARDMTVEDLLLHRAGLAYGIFGGNPVEMAYQQAGLFEPSDDLAAKMDRLGQLPLIAQPGEAWFYSYSIDVLGRIAEVVTGQRLGDALDSRFFAPLGMTETSFRVQPDQAARFASNYQIAPDGTFSLQEDALSSPFLNDNAFQSGGGGLVSTLGDYAKFTQMMANGGALGGTRILDEDTVALMMSDHMGDDYTPMLPWIGGASGAGFGYGGSVQLTATPEQQTTKGRYPGQWGWGGAARTNMFIDPANDSFGIIMLQFFSPEDPKLHDDFQALVLAQTRDDASED